MGKSKSLGQYTFSGAGRSGYLKTRSPSTIPRLAFLRSFLPCRICLNPLGLRPAVCARLVVITFISIVSLLYVFSATGSRWPKAPSRVANQVTCLENHVLRKNFGVDQKAENIWFEHTSSHCQRAGAGQRKDHRALLVPETSSSTLLYLIMVLKMDIAFSKLSQ